jgi:hypothetical protein
MILEFNSMLEGINTAEGLIVAGDAAWADYTFTAPVRVALDSLRNEIALVFRYVDAANFYWAGLGCWAHRVSISKMVAGAPIELVSSGTIDEVVTGDTYVLAVKAVGNQIELYVNGALELSIIDDSFSAGKIGFRLYSSHVEVDYADAFASPVVTTTTPVLLLITCVMLGMVLS